MLTRSDQARVHGSAPLARRFSYLGAARGRVPLRERAGQVRFQLIRVVSGLGAILSCAVILGGCAFQEHRKALERMHAAGDYAAAASDLDSKDTQKLYGQKNRVLLWMDRGAVALALDEDERCI